MEHENLGSLETSQFAIAEVDAVRDGCFDMHRLLFLTYSRDVVVYQRELRQAGYFVSTNDKLPDDLAQCDIILIPVNGSQASCLDQIRSIREVSQVPIMVLSGKEDVTECVITLELGADDYVREPVATLELLARIRVLLRRSECSSPLSSVLTIDDIELHVGSRSVKRNGNLLDLTGVEFEFLRLLMFSAGNVLTREVIAQKIFRRRLSSCDRSIDVHMSGLRKKLGLRDDNTDRIRTIRGFGYIYLIGNK